MTDGVPCVRTDICVEREQLPGDDGGDLSTEPLWVLTSDPPSSIPNPPQAEKDGTEDIDKSYAAQGNGKFMQSSIGGAERRTYRVEADAKETPEKEKKAAKAGGTVDPGIKQQLKVTMRI